ncbi:MAG: bifunctional 5,10-methylenetetrahydrofolate dehydrogenase/5,10-methenyltetrahydrofolate cyclohydrolase [Opitutales bacterium]
MHLIDGNAISAAIYAELKAEVAALPAPAPAVVFVRVGEDPASVFYVNKKHRVAADIGVQSELRVFPETITQQQLLAEIDVLNANPAVHGILVQAPLPPHIDDRTIFNHVSVGKDVDGFNEVNLGRLAQEDASGFVSCTPAGIIELLRRSEIETSGRRAVVIGRSLIVGKPVALLLMRKGPGGDATVTLCHSRTRELASVVREADIVVAAMGRARSVTADMIKPGATVIDVGINRVDDPTAKKSYRIVGDVDFEGVKAHCGAITPVPGGVGPMTVAMLMRNTLLARRRAGEV